MRKDTLTFPVDAPRKVIIAPLDWGLGHATRIIPIIRYLIDSGRLVTVAATSAGISVIRPEFPDLEFLTIPGYRMDYPRKGTMFLFHMIRRLPRLISAILKEYLWLRKAQRLHRWDLIISDNRYGFRHPGVPSVIITHQINIRTEISSGADQLLKKINLALIRRFNECWIPDEAAWPGLAGTLSHGGIPPRTRYIGPLSRFAPLSKVQRSGLLIMLSGPEPQRTLLESKILTALNSYTGAVTLVRGLPVASAIPSASGGHIIQNHLPAEALGKSIAGAALVICRAGYSSVMDLVRTGTPAVLIPTPGQTEQEYLARHLEANGFFPYIDQDDFTIEAALIRAETFNFRPKMPDFQTYLSVLNEILPPLHVTVKS